VCALLRWIGVFSISPQPEDQRMLSFVLSMVHAVCGVVDVVASGVKTLV
jgi:hypothetical protein